MISWMDIVIGLGGNLGEPGAVFARALEVLAVEGRVTVVSSLGRTRPVGPSQPEFLNAAALVSWPEGPRALLDRCRELEVAAGRAAVMAGAGTNDTAANVALARGAQQAGAGAILAVSPYYNKPTPAGLIAHYGALAEATGGAGTW